MKLILGNHWTEAPEGWTILKEEDQDITKRFQFLDDDSVDVIFTEHVVEHCNLIGGINYFKESYRVLKPGGILRTVCPMIDRLIEFRDDFDYIRKNYIRNSLAPYYKAEEEALKELGINIEHHGLPFLIDSLIKNHNHKFVWDIDLMMSVIIRVGFSNAIQTEVGKSEFDSSNCLERKIRGIDTAHLNYVGVKVPEVWDCESLVIEAKK